MIKMADLKQVFWSMPLKEILKSLEASKEGLTSYEAEKKQSTYGANSIKPKKSDSTMSLLLSQFKSPIIIILFFAIGLSFFLHDTIDAMIILAIVMISGLLGFWQEYGANNAVAKLLEVVEIKTNVLRDGKPLDISVEDIVPGDVVILKAGAVIPADSLILESDSLNIDEATLTGETYPVEKQAGVVPLGTPLNERRNSLSPQLLPAIISINLAHGAKMMAKGKVIVKRLAAIENFGSMNVLCSDKTGTLTDGTVKLQSTMDVNGKQSDKVFLYAYLNASFESGFMNPIDEAIRAYKSIDVKDYVKLDEHPYDFIRKRLSIMLTMPCENPWDQQTHIMITKGALTNILGICTRAEIEDGKVVDIKEVSASIERQFQDYSEKGYRTCSSKKG